MSFTLQNNIPAFNRELQRRAGALAVKTAHGIEAHIKIGMAEPKSGRQYGDHVASAPGESPAIDMGAYVNALQVEKTGEAQAVVGTNQEQSLVLEFGGVIIAPRPHFGPAFDAAAPEFARELKGLVA